MGEEVLAVGALPTERGLMLLASTRAGTICYDAEGRAIGASSLVAQQFRPAVHQGRQAILALLVDGGVAMAGAH